MKLEREMRGATAGVVLKFLSSFRMSRLLLLPKALEESILTTCMYTQYLITV